MNEQEQTATGMWDGAEVVSVYTRAQAIEDGVLADIGDIAQEAGFKMPVSATQGVMGILRPSKALEAEGQDWVGRTWDMLAILRRAIRNSNDGDAVYFTPLFIMEPGGRPEPVEMWAKCGPGDSGEPVITVMLRGED